MDLLTFYIILYSSLLRVSFGRPNIIILVADDLGWNDLSFHGSSQIPTPNLDYLANNGIILNNYYVCPICSPSRSALMTGFYPIHTGLQHDVIYVDQPWGLPLSKILLPQYLRKLGYSTHAVGKWHLGFFRKEYTPTFRGFDSHYGYWGGKEDYFDHTQQMGEMWGLDFHHNMKSVTDALGKYSTALFTNHTVHIIKHHNSSKAVHSANSYATLQAPENYIKRFPNIKDKNRKIFAGMVSAMDDSVKAIVSALEAKNMLNNSIIVFTTDNGGPAAGFNNNAASNWPLRGVKATLWEGGVRGISFIWSPLLKNCGRTSMEMMHITDWLPTLYHAAGGNVSNLGKLDGYDLWDTLSFNRPSPRSEVLLNIDPINKVSALRVGNFKVIQGTVYGGQWDGWYGPSGRENFTQTRNAKSSSEKLYHKAEITCGPIPKNATSSCYPAKKPCLFDVQNDPCEYYNLAEDKPHMLDTLLKKLAEYSASAVPPGNKPLDPQSNPKYHNYQWINWKDYV
ncbi:arylsulfatase B-like isoform X3 [Stegodyphus dumicola]|uniref:arylsulfatase B-like isoform X3 n=1 Tax=Stegodyphus dumicola TaxID=202533 RepID=UPI0015B332E6|nr:arylsulfatase B-like isoform X3 [Stegodyphus dumicola]